MRTPTPAAPSPPFRGYRVSLASQVVPAHLHHLASAHPTLEPLCAGRPSVALSVSDATALYDAAEASARARNAPFPLHFTPIRHARGRTLPFEAVALGPGELLYLVHEGFFGPARGRQAAIAAVEACGALPVPALALPPLRRRVPPATAEHHVDTLIEREPELHVGRGGSAA